MTHQAPVYEDRASTKMGAECIGEETYPLVEVGAGSGFASVFDRGSRGEGARVRTRQRPWLPPAQSPGACGEDASLDAVVMETVEDPRLPALSQGWGADGSCYTLRSGQETRDEGSLSTPRTSPAHRDQCAHWTQDTKLPAVPEPGLGPSPGVTLCPVWPQRLSGGGFPETKGED